MATHSFVKGSTEYEAALKQVRRTREFYNHVVSYVVVNLFLFTLNALTSPGIWWFYWPAFFWGIGLIFHGLGVFVFGEMFGKDWEEREVEKLLKKKNN